MLPGFRLQHFVSSLHLCSHTTLLWSGDSYTPALGHRQYCLCSLFDDPCAGKASWPAWWPVVGPCSLLRPARAAVSPASRAPVIQLSVTSCIGDGGTRECCIFAFVVQCYKILACLALIFSNCINWPKKKKISPCKLRNEKVQQSSGSK